MMVVAVRILILIVALVALVTSAWAGGSAPDDCYRLFTGLQYRRFAHKQLGDKSPTVLLADGTEVPLARAFEKEGLLYSDIADWFPSANPEAASLLRKRLADELAGRQPGTLTRWLNHYAEEYVAEGLEMSPADWRQLSIRQKLNFILREPDFFRRINVQGREDLFFSGVLTFDDLAITESSPLRLTVGDDLGSYEVRSKGGTVDRNTYLNDREIVENFLEGKVGHQHKVHAWPVDKAKRELMAPRYIELLDAATWYLYWRQMKRNPSEVESILSHPYLGVYTRWWLEKLFSAVVEMEPERFNNKFRMIGARNFDADPNIPKQNTAGPLVPDWELRSGNKSENRDFVEDLIEARISSGDYTGLRDFRFYHFDATAPIDALAYRFVGEPDIIALQEFEQVFPGMRYIRKPDSHNHLRTKILAPLLPWENRLSIPYKIETLHEEQRLYARRLVAIARNYLSKRSRLRKAESIRELNEQTLERLERSEYRFASRVRLDLDFERYLSPVPRQLPSITVKTTGPVDVNEMAQGVEYSMRFPAEVEIVSAEVAEREIQRMVVALSERFGGGKIEKMNSGGHGHGASVRYKYTDPYGRVWRVEWDGIQRRYVNGRLVNPHGGHIEVPSPKFSPQDPYRDIAPVFEAARSNGQVPRRSAGGGHVNTDLAPLKALAEHDGVARIKSLIGYFESNREMITFLWQHPKRAHAARPIELKPGFAERLAAFDGGWNELAVFLYTEQYFNAYIGRKPRYVEMDLTGLMAPAVPREYRKGTLDIKNPKEEWFPDFGTGKDRVEFRFYDAPTNEYMAALQLKYHRAMLNTALNSAEPVPLTTRYQPGIKDQWRRDPRAFVEAAEAHLRELGLDPEEFRPLIHEAWEVQQETPAAPRKLDRYQDWLPPRDPSTTETKGALLLFPAPLRQTA